jgi:riboflavin synthase
MFTGIVQAVGQIVSVQVPPGREGCRLTVDLAPLPVDDIAVGDSIAINGACMTVVTRSGTRAEFDVSAESLRCTVGLDRPGPVNLEKAMRAHDRLGGHLVSGHVDGTAEVLAMEPLGESWRFRVCVPTAFAGLVTEKGSIAVDGVSLTINRIEDTSRGAEVEMNLIPHTWQETVLQHRRAGDRVNIELDQLAKQVERMVRRLVPGAQGT